MEHREKEEEQALTLNEEAFKKLEKYVPEELRQRFGQQFDDRSKFITPILLTFAAPHFESEQIGGDLEQSDMPRCEVCLIAEVKAYAMPLMLSGITIVLSFGKEPVAEETKDRYCIMNVYLNGDEIISLVHSEPDFVARQNSAFRMTGHVDSGECQMAFGSMFLYMKSAEPDNHYELQENSRLKFFIRLFKAIAELEG